MGLLGLQKINYMDQERGGGGETFSSCCLANECTGGKEPLEVRRRVHAISRSIPAIESYRRRDGSSRAHDTFYDSIPLLNSSESSLFNKNGLFPLTMRVWGVTACERASGSNKNPLEAVVSRMIGVAPASLTISG